MKSFAKATILIAALPTIAVAQPAPQDTTQCAAIPDEAITTSFDALPDVIRTTLKKFPNFSPTDAPCKLDASVLHSHTCFERAALLHGEWIVIFNYWNIPVGKGHAFVWKVSGDTFNEVSWPNAYASLCTLEKLGAIRDGYVISKEEGKRAVFGPMP